MTAPDRMREGPNACPTDRGRWKAREWYLCRTCWYRLPESMRNSVHDAVRAKDQWSSEVRAQVSMAIDWLKDH